MSSIAENSEVDDDIMSPTTTTAAQGSIPPQIPKTELELLSIIGEGGFCDVWEGRWFGATVAIKRLKLTGDKRIDGTKASDFVKEMKLHAKLSFPQIIPVMGMCIEDPKEMYLIMEQAPLGSLFGLLHVHDHRTKPYVLQFSPLSLVLSYTLMDYVVVC
jgi:serine/threonine protein kinase